MDEITIYDIAKMAGVSASTVSRVINNYPYVKKDTRERVLKLLSENNYVPNETARSLVNQSTKMVGILIADMRTTHHTEGVYHVEKEFSKKGYSCLIYNTGVEPESQVQYIQMLSQRKIDAVVMIGSIYQNEMVRNAVETYIPSIPVAICNGFLEGKNIYGVVTDERNGVKECVKFLFEKGRRHVAFVSNSLTPSNKEKLEGYLEGVSFFLEDVTPVTAITDRNVEVVFEVTGNVLKEHPEVDAIIFAEDYLALAGMHYLSSIGKRVPEDIAIMGINNSRYGQISIPSLTTLDNMLFDTSLNAVRNILQVLGGEYVTKKMVLCPRIVERSST
ncbi:MAG: LacI family DNA-binding transcriptional regulator [Spirochaetales bacterium]|nr:LacI family DNA-binding transcriptional regulator [Candidatus Physcosoma equi]